MTPTRTAGNAEPVGVTSTAALVLTFMVLDGAPVFAARHIAQALTMPGDDVYDALVVLEACDLAEPTNWRGTSWRPLLGAVPFTT